VGNGLGRDADPLVGTDRNDPLGIGAGRQLNPASCRWTSRRCRACFRMAWPVREPSTANRRQRRGTSTCDRDSLSVGPRQTASAAHLQYRLGPIPGGRPVAGAPFASPRQVHQLLTSARSRSSVSHGIESAPSCCESGAPPLLRAKGSRQRMLVSGGFNSSWKHLAICWYCHSTTSGSVKSNSQSISRKRPLSRIPETLRQALVFGRDDKGPNGI